MNHSKLSKRLLIIVGSLGVLASVLLIIKGSDFSTYFLAGFCGIILIVKALMYQRKNKDEVKVS